VKPPFHLRAVLTASIILVLAVLVPSRSISAHAHLERSEPTAGARLAAAPSAIRLWFSEAPELALTTVTLLDSSGTAVTLGPAAQDADGPSAVRFAIGSALAPGLYRVKWRTAAADGHPSSGSFVFRVLPAPAPAAIEPRVTPPVPAAVTADTTRPAAEAGALTPAYVVVRAALFLAMLALLGAVAFRFAVLSRGAVQDVALRDELTTATAGGGALVSAIFLVMLLAKLFFQVRMLSGDASLAPEMRIVALDTRWGMAWCIQLLGGALALAGLLLARRVRAGWRIAALASVMIAVGASLGGHAGASERLRTLSVLTDALHVIGAAGWLGTLLWLVVTGLPIVLRSGDARDQRVAALVNAFSPAALAFAALVTVTGVVSAWLRLGALPPLWSSSYGQLLLIKLALLTGVGLAGLYNWRRMRPALGTDDASRRLHRSATLELALGFAVIVVTAVLVATPTP
jgi:copper transport protein